MRGLFVTGTGTGVGKTIVSAALLAAMRAAGEPVRAHKPVVTGLADPPGAWPPDHELLALVAGMNPTQVAPLRFEPAVSPHLAAALAGEPIDPHGLARRARAAGGHGDEPTPAQTAGAAGGRDELADPSRARTADGSPGRDDETEPSRAQPPTLIVEGVGGLLTPLADDYSVRALAVELGLPLIVAAPPGLGTINHTLLTIETARAAGLSVAAVVLTPWPAEPSAMEHSNRDTIARLGKVEVAALEQISNADIAALAGAGGRLPWRDWVLRPSFIPSDA